MTAHIAKHYIEEIKSSDCYDDWEFPDSVVDQLSESLSRYNSETIFEADYRASAGSNAKHQLTVLIKAIDNLLPKMVQATCNSYLTTPLMDNFAGGPFQRLDNGDFINEEGQRICKSDYRELQDQFFFGIRADLEKIRESATTALQKEQFLQHPFLPNFTATRPSETYKYKLIKELSDTLKSSFKSTPKNELASIIKELLAFVGETLSIRRITEIIVGEKQK